MAAQPVPRRVARDGPAAGRGGLEPGEPAHPRAEAVAAEQPAGADALGRAVVRVQPRLDARGVLPQGTQARVHQVRPGVERHRAQVGVQHRAAHAAARPAGEQVVGAGAARAVGDARQRVPGRVGAERAHRAQGAGQQALAARLVQHARAAVGHDDVEPGAARVHRRGEAHGPAADDEDVGVGRAAHARTRAAASARSSTGTRKPSSRIALSTVNAVAVIQHVCTSGSATPSSTTAT